ncbi:MAG: glycoside hydrolase family 32 protein [Clostridia bacterium]|nr:glycoside hydrolase family 32 protein [Clostridia bacterium]
MSKRTDITEAERLAIEQDIFADMDAAHADPTHPRWHLTPPSHCMIDFWGAVDVDGWHHIFYHTFRYAGKLGEDTVFGHARSRDFLQYEQLPLPICPAKEELRMNDGFICMKPDGIPVMLYTSVPRDGSPRAHYAAVGDRELRRFERCPEPFMTLENHGGPAFGWGWSDPYVFEAFGRTFMLMSKCIEDGKNRMPIYEALDDSFTRWEYRGIMFEDNGEVVNFFPMGDKWVMIFCPYGPIRWFVGTFDEATLTFRAENDGILCHGFVNQTNPTDRGFYATCVYQEAERRILCGWMSGFPEDRMWSGCMGTPRELGINDRLQLTSMPIREIETLHIGEAMRFSGESGCMELGAPSLDMTLELCGDVVLEFEGMTTITVTSDGFAIDGFARPGTLAPAEKRRLRILMDCSFVELYFDDGAVSAARPVRYAGEAVRLHVHGAADITAWQMRAVPATVG